MSSIIILIQKDYRPYLWELRKSGWKRNKNVVGLKLIIVISLYLKTYRILSHLYFCFLVLFKIISVNACYYKLCTIRVN